MDFENSVGFFADYPPGYYYTMGKASDFWSYRYASDHL